MSVIFFLTYTRYYGVADEKKIKKFREDFTFKLSDTERFEKRLQDPHKLQASSNCITKMS